MTQQIRQVHGSSMSGYPLIKVFTWHNFWTVQVSTSTDKVSASAVHIVHVQGALTLHLCNTCVYIGYPSNLPAVDGSGAVRVHSPFWQ